MIHLYVLQVGMFKIHPEIPESMSLEAKAFILRCFEPDPDRRATALDLLTDEFLTVTSRKKKSKSGFTGRSERRRALAALLKRGRLDRLSHSGAAALFRAQAANDPPQLCGKSVTGK